MPTPRLDRLAEPSFRYADGALHAEGVPVAAIAAEIGTPFYCYSAGALRQAYRALANALTQLPATICYGVKANSNPAVITVLAQEGAGADVVSEGEIRKALAAGVPAGRIVFSGVGKTEREIAFALEAGIRQINIESEPELAAISAVAQRMGTRATVAIRVNPSVDARTHHKITTGRRQDKFGVPIDRAVEVYRLAASLPGVEPKGIAIHIGSQLLSLDPYRRAFKKVAKCVADLRRAGLTVSTIDLGGGIGITYRDEVPIPYRDYAALVGEIVAPLGCDIVFEPGRAMVGNAGILVASVVYVKEGADRPIVVLDAAMNDLIRPALYDAYHPIVPLKERGPAREIMLADVVGPICETGDTFAIERPLPRLAAGDHVAVGGAGAYGAVMSSQYNSRP
ncbi:MAG: diaminopimelate decarboxylase, partial [Rhodospirillaceae bacterium]|nr:diaminopimelate decarboxylase [Rhodospirillaceae bacterium]